MRCIAHEAVQEATKRHELLSPSPRRCSAPFLNSKLTQSDFSLYMRLGITRPRHGGRQNRRRLGHGHFLPAKGRGCSKGAYACPANRCPSYMKMYVNMIDCVSPVGRTNVCRIFFSELQTGFPNMADRVWKPRLPCVWQETDRCSVCESRCAAVLCACVDLL